MNLLNDLARSCGSIRKIWKYIIYSLQFSTFFTGFEACDFDVEAADDGTACFPRFPFPFPFFLGLPFRLGAETNTVSNSFQYEPTVS